MSFNRPLLVFPWGSPCTWELPLLRWAERSGYRIDVCTNLDLERHPEMLPHYRLVLSVGHDEYWSAGMRDRLEAFVAQGGNCAFFSGNTCCWQVRVEDHGRALVCHKRAIDRDPVSRTGDLRQLSTLWSDPRLKRPENMLTGGGFTFGGYNGIFGAYERGLGEGEYKPFPVPIACLFHPWESAYILPQDRPYMLECGDLSPLSFSVASGVTPPRRSPGRPEGNPKR